MKKSKLLLFSLTKKDFQIEPITCPGPGGQNINRRHNGVRIVHPASGVKVECCEERSSERNKEIAFNRLVESARFKSWHKLETARRLLNYRDIEQMIESIVDKSMNQKNIRLEVKDQKGRWVEIDWNDINELQKSDL